MKGAAVTHERLRVNFEQSREAVRRARERADAAASRARLIRATLPPHTPVPAGLRDERAALLHAVSVESARLADERNRIIAVVSHELRQPLAAAMAALQVLQSAKADGAAEKAWAILARQHQQMMRLLDDLLDMSRLSVRTLQIHKTRVDVGPIVERAIEAVAATASERSICLENDVDQGPLAVTGDADRLQQIVANLLSNAVRYTPAKGHIAVMARRRESKVVIVVTDTGRGISNEELESIFDPFFRGTDGDPSGLGIGLSLVKGLAELHGGFVTAESPGPGHGSTFTVVLPAAV